MIKADKTYRLNSFEDNAKGRAKSKARCLFGIILVSCSLTIFVINSNSSTQVWAEFEATVLRGFASYVCFRVSRYKDARPG